MVERIQNERDQALAVLREIVSAIENQYTPAFREAHYTPEEMAPHCHRRFVGV